MSQARLDISYARYLMRKTWVVILCHHNTHDEKFNIAIKPWDVIGCHLIKQLFTWVSSYGRANSVKRSLIFQLTGSVKTKTNGWKDQGSSGF